MISVAMATYNGELYIKKQIESILNQSYPVDEIIIYDDCSSDNTVNIIKSIADEKIRLRENQNNVGYIRNFYNAIKETKGDYIFLADQDDIWDRDKVKKMIDCITTYKSSLVCSNYKLIDSKDKEIINISNYNIDSYFRKKLKLYEQITFTRLIFGNILQGCTYCFNSEVRDVYLKINNEKIIHDYQIILIASCLKGVLFYNEPLILYRLHSNNAIGFSNKSINIPKKIKRKPLMVEFLNEVSYYVKIKNKWIYILIFYLRIPFLRKICINKFNFIYKKGERKGE